MCCCEEAVLVTIDVGLKSMKRKKICNQHSTVEAQINKEHYIKPGSKISPAVICVTKRKY